MEPEIIKLYIQNLIKQILDDICYITEVESRPFYSGSPNIDFN
jgi:hypothetical protein